MPTMLIIFILSACAAVKADIVVKPRDTEAVIGDSTYFDCESNVNTNEVNWYHVAVGAKDHEDICLYCVGRIHPQYETRIEVERNSNTNNSRLRIREVQRQDAGRYICQENEGIGKSTTAQLVVLESNPSCTSNLKPDGVLGPNDCGMMLSKLVHVSEPKSISTPVAVAVSSSVIIAVEFVFIILVYVYLRKGPKTGKNQHTSTEQEKHLLNEKARRPRLVKQHSVTTKSAKGKGLHIRGMTILGNKLFAVTQKCSAVEVFDCTTLNSMDRWNLNKLIRPSDIASCKENRCLYIMDWKGDSVKKEVLRVDPNGEFLHNWETGDDYGDFISVTVETNIIVTCLGKNEFNEYSPEGVMIRKIYRQGADVPIHAIKLNDDKFLVSCGDASHLMHRVCIVDADGKVKQSFGEEQGPDLEHVDHPKNLAVFADGSVAVLDNGNRRVLLLDKNLKFKQVLLSNDTHGLENPTRLLLDESNGQLLVADRQSGTGAIRIFLLTDLLYSNP